MRIQIMNKQIMKKEMFYVIEYSNGVYLHGYFESYCNALDYAIVMSYHDGLHFDFTIGEYECEADYFVSI